MKSLVEYIQEQDLINYRRLMACDQDGDVWVPNITRWDPASWTTDPVMRDFKFGNIRRELDRTNRHLYHLFTPGHFAQRLPINAEIWSCLAHRSVSCVSFTRRHGLFVSFADFKHAYLTDKQLGRPVRPPSFMSCGSDEDFLNSIAACVNCSDVFANRFARKPTLMEAYLCFKSVTGKFTAWQAALDCMMYHWVDNPPSDPFVCLGPGAVSCLSALHLGKGDYDSMVINVNSKLEVAGYLPLRYEEVEGALCEYGRYIRYNTKWPGKYRHFTATHDPFPVVSLDTALIYTMEVVS